MDRMHVTYSGIPAAELDQLQRTHVDVDGNTGEPFVDTEGGWPLRCCLALSVPGDELLIAASSPFPWASAYRETGPVVVHASACDGHDGRFPEAVADTDLVLRAYGSDGGRERTQVYDRNRYVASGGAVERFVAEALADPRVEFVQGRSALAGCFRFAASRG